MLNKNSLPAHLQSPLLMESSASSNTHSSIHDQWSHLNKAYTPIYIIETGLSLYNACKIIKNIRFYKTFVPKNFIIMTFN